jgi:hypothetical protein
VPRTPALPQAQLENSRGNEKSDEKWPQAEKVTGIKEHAKTVLYRECEIGEESIEFHDVLSLCHAPVSVADLNLRPARQI